MIRPVLRIIFEFVILEFGDKLAILGLAVLGLAVLQVVVIPEVILELIVF